MMRNIWILSFAFALIIFFTASCKMDTIDKEDERVIRLIYTDWSESIALTYLSGYLLEEKVGYKVIMKLTDVESAYEELARGDYHVFTDAWLPETHKRYYEPYSDKIELLGISYPEARTGFVVPEYSELYELSDLKNYRYPIIGIDSGAGVMHKARSAIQKYDLKVQLKSFSEDTMVSRLGDSIQRRNDIVVTGWEPHWIFARYDVRFLDDPDNIFGGNEKIYTISHSGLQDEHPHAVRFFERMQLTEKQLNSLVYQVRVNNEDPVKGVKEWIKQNEYVVNQWVKDLAPERKKIM